jgi:hypothetical protein
MNKYCWLYENLVDCTGETMKSLDFLIGLTTFRAGVEFTVYDSSTVYSCNWRARKQGCAIVSSAIAVANILLLVEFRSEGQFAISVCSTSR